MTMVVTMVAMMMMLMTMVMMVRMTAMVMKINVVCTAIATNVPMMTTMPSYHDNFIRFSMIGFFNESARTRHERDVANTASLDHKCQMHDLS